MRRPHRPPDDERGAGAVSSAFAFATFLGFVVLATNVALGLWARSATSAIAFDEARRLATRPADCDRGPARVRDRIGGWWTEVRVEATCDGDSVAVRVQARRSVARLDRTFVVRVEAER